MHWSDGWPPCALQVVVGMRPVLGRKFTKSMHRSVPFCSAPFAVLQAHITSCISLCARHFAFTCCHGLKLRQSQIGGLQCFLSIRCRRVLLHESGHCVPQQARHCQTIVDFIAQFLEVPLIHHKPRPHHPPSKHRPRHGATVTAHEASEEKLHRQGLQAKAKKGRQWEWGGSKTGDWEVEGDVLMGLMEWKRKWESRVPVCYLLTGLSSFNILNANLPSAWGKWQTIDPLHRACTSPAPS